MKHVATWLGGSHMYNLNTDKSDIDQRGLFLHEDVDAIIGLKRFDQETRNNKEEDVHNVELRYFLAQLSKGTLNYLEPLWNPSKVTAQDDVLWQAILKNKLELFPTELIGKKLFGFLNSQFQDTFDDLKKSDATSNRGENIAKYGYNPKSAMHTLRLAETGFVLFKTGIYRVEPFSLRRECMKLKTHPEKFKPGEVRRMMENAQKSFEYARANTSIEFRTFNRDLANQIILDAYAPLIAQRYKER